MWDFAKFLVERIYLRDLVMWIIFSITGYLAFPVDWVVFVNSKTPAHFPDWLGLFDLFIISVSLLLSISAKATLSLFRKYRRQKDLLNEIDRVYDFLCSLSPEEEVVIADILSNNKQPTKLTDTPTVLGLEFKGIILNIIELGYEPRYILSPAAEQILAKNFALLESN